MKKIERIINDYAGITAFFFVIIGFVIIITFLFIAPFNDWSFKKDSELFAQYGDFIGGFIGTIFTLAGFFLIYKTLITQQETFKQQDLVSRQDRFEITFFNLLKNQNEITDNIKAYFKIIEKDKAPEDKIIEGRDFFIYSKIELINIWESLSSEKYLGYFDEGTAYEFSYELDSLNSEYTNLDPEEVDAIEREIYKKIKLTRINGYYGISKKIWESVQQKETFDKIKLTYSLFFQKYHYAAGHYFRHLYHILNFSETIRIKQLSLSNQPNEREEINHSISTYVSFVQAQMSSFELTLLFYNSTSFPKMLSLIKTYNFLDNLAKEDLINISHDCIDGLKLKSRKELI